ncbi:medium-chain acyl-CoA ligase ACSF2, mitochondrial-like [Glandiceps talaboti]
MAYGATRLTKSYCHKPGKSAFCGRTFGQVFDEHLTLYPDHEAIVFCKDNTRISYSKLMSDVSALSAGLKTLSLQQGDRIGLWFDESYEYLIGNMAAIRVGFIPAFIPLKVTRDQLCYVINKVECSALIVGPDQYKSLLEICPDMKNDDTTNFHLDKFPSLRHLLISSPTKAESFNSATDLKSLMVEGVGSSTPSDGIDPDDVCYIAFTSGSTGFPKAVAISHRAAIEGSKASANAAFYTMGDEEKQHVKMVVTDPFASTATPLRETLLALYEMTIIIPKNKEVSTILSTIEQERGTSVNFPPAQLFDLIQVHNTHSYDLSSLVSLAVGGGVLPLEVLRSISESLKLSIGIAYGSTECLPAIYYIFDKMKASQTSYVNVGYPVDNVEVKIVKEGKIVAINTPGEVCMRSPYLFTWYWGDEEKTKEVKSPSGWYHSGDIGRMDETGCLEILGRKDDMILKSGTNIYPAEIEHQLVAYPGLKYVQVVPVPDKKFGNELCLCLCKDESVQSESEDELQTKVLEYLRGRVQDFHMPKYVLIFESFPLTRSGKIQRNELAKAASKRLEISPKC